MVNHRGVSVLLGVAVAITLAGCSASSPSASWVTGKDVLDSLKEQGFECSWSGSGEQVVLANPLTGEESEYPAVRCDGYGIALFESQQAILEQVASSSQCVPLTTADRSDEGATMPLILGDTFLIVPDGEFPGAAQPLDFIKAFGGEELTLLELYERACPDAPPSDDAASQGSGLAGPPPGGLIDRGGQRVPGIAVGSGERILDVWVDPQAPAAGALAQAALPELIDSAEAGAFTLILRPAAFLDRSLANDASSRAISAAGCAMERDLGAEFLIAILANQPVTEGEGWTNDELVALGQEAGLEADSLAACLDSGRYLAWAQQADEVFSSAGIVGVPYAELDGVEVPTSDLADPGSFVAGLGAS
jgi:Thioredoxin